MASTGLYQRHRPDTLDGVVGQEDAVMMIKGFGRDIPNAICLHGPTGTGKTTLARILSRMLGCPPENRFDYCEINCGIVKHPIDTVREIKVSMTSKALVGENRVWVLDEAQTFSRNKGAQEALLKVLEDGPDHAYFLICTSEPKRLLPTILGRCTQIPCRAIPDKVLAGLVRDVSSKEKAKPPLDDEVVEKIVASAAGSARNALVELEKVIGLKGVEDRLAVVGGAGVQRAAFDLVKALMPFSGSASWGEVAKVLADVKDEDPEGLRQMVLASARTSLLKHGMKNHGKVAYKVIRCLDQPLYDRNSGHALLAAACAEIVFGG